MNKMHKFNRKLVNNLKETYKNKLAALALLILGGLSIQLEGDATAFIFIACIAIPVFFAKENLVLTTKREP